MPEKASFSDSNFVVDKKILCLYKYITSKGVVSNNVL